MQTFQQSKSGHLVNLDDVMENQNSFGRPMKTFVGYNLGNRTFTLQLSLFELKEFTEVANERSNSDFIAQRKLDIMHATQIAKYALKGLLSSVERMYKKQNVSSTRLTEIITTLGRQPYMSIPPIVASFRNCMPNGMNLKVVPLVGVDQETNCFKFFLNHGDVLWVIDGQHRRKGLQLLFEYIEGILTAKKYPAKSLLYTQETKELTADDVKIWNDCLAMSKQCHIAVEVHLGLGMDEERQLFHDLNNLQRKVEKSLALHFDNSNPVNRFIKEVLIDSLFHEYDFDVLDRDKVSWQEDTAGLTRKDLVAINAVLFLNKSNINNATPLTVLGKEEIARTFWEKVLEIPGIRDKSPRQKTVAAQPVVLKALAKLIFDFFFGKNLEWGTRENQEKLMLNISQIDFAHSNPMWQYYSLSEIERDRYGLTGLKDYLPEDADGNRDLGNFDSSNEFRFGAKHNDIYPIIGDMIRWKLGLPKRRKD